MEISQIEERIEKKQIQITKIQKRIAKWEKAKSQATTDYDISECEYELRSANRDLKEAEITLNKYTNILKMEQVKQQKLSENKVKVIADFLDDWKAKVTDYIHEDVKRVKEYKEIKNKASEIYNCYWKMDISRDEADAQYKKLSKEAKAIKENCSDISFEVYDPTAKNLTDDKALRKILDKEADNKYLNMIDAITKIVGEITDANYLSIGPKGNIEGYIKGTQGKAHVETIGAGGYNDGVILASGRHGQCYHYRTLINKIE